MYSKQLVCLAVAALLIGACHAQCYGRATSLAPSCGCGPFVAPAPAPYNLNPLTVSALNSCVPPVAPLAAFPVPCGCPNKSNLNVDQLVNTLVNALVFTTTGAGKGGAGGNGGGAGGSNDDPLIGLDLLYRLSEGGTGLLGLSAGATDILQATLGRGLN